MYCSLHYLKVKQENSIMVPFCWQLTAFQWKYGQKQNLTWLLSSLNFLTCMLLTWAINPRGKLLVHNLPYKPGMHWARILLIRAVDEQENTLLNIDTLTLWNKWHFSILKLQTMISFSPSRLYISTRDNVSLQKYIITFKVAP